MKKNPFISNTGFWLGVLLLPLFLNAQPLTRAKVTPTTTTQPIAAGPMLGYSAMREVAIWVQTKQAATVQVRYWPQNQPTAKKNTPAVKTQAEKEFIAHLFASYLEPGTTYTYEVLVDGKVVPRPMTLTFKTNPLWQWRTDPPAFSVAFGSCDYTNDPPYDRPGRAYGGDKKIYKAIAQAQPDLMLWGGDNVYFREVDWDSPKMMAYRYNAWRQQEEIQPILGNIHHYATWDDHDYGPNDADRSYILKDTALDLFKQYWINPAYGLRATPGVFQQFSWGDADFFLLDNRYYRSPNRHPDSTSKTMFGKAQLDWLLDALSSSNATFKIVMSGGQILNDAAIFENFATYGMERRTFLDELVRRKISGLLFLTGDRHHTVLRKKELAGLYTLYDFTSSSITAGISQPVAKELDTQVVENTLLKENNFGLLNFSGPRTDRTLTLKAIDGDGKTRWTYAIKATDLQPKKQ